MIRILCTSLVLLVIHSQCLSQILQQEINNQIWKVQLEAMKENDVDKFLSVMSDDVVQISYDRNMIRDKAGFEKQAADIYNKIKEKRLTRNMEFRFLNRIATDKIAFEDGFFRYETIDERSAKREFYGYFQVTLRKETDAWRVLVDYDAENYHGIPVTAEMFNSAKTLSSFEH